jgi:hypothetical protein
MREYTGDLKAPTTEGSLALIEQAGRLFVNPADELGVRRKMEEALRGFVPPTVDPDELPDKLDREICKGCGLSFISVEGFRYACTDCDSSYIGEVKEEAFEDKVFTCIDHMVDGLFEERHARYEERFGADIDEMFKRTETVHACREVGWTL